MAMAAATSSSLLIPSSTPSASASVLARYSLSSSSLSLSCSVSDCSVSSSSNARQSQIAASCSCSPRILQGKQLIVRLDEHLGGKAAFLRRRFNHSKWQKSTLDASKRPALCSAKLAGDVSGGNDEGGFESRKAPGCGPGMRQEQSGKWQLRKSGFESQEIREQNEKACDVEEVEARPWWEQLRAGLNRNADGGASGSEEWGWLSRKLATSGMLLAAIPGMAGAGWNLEGPQSVLQALGVLAAIITVHETGHFLAARLQGIVVTKFAVGFGPTLAKFSRDGVEYSLRTFPFGGFVAFPDDDPSSEFDPDDPNLLKNRPIKDRAIVISAGVIANLIFAYSVLFTQTLSVGLLEQEMFPGVLVPEVIGKSAAARAGMKPGDVVLGVDGYKFSAKEAAVFELVDTIKKSGGQKLSLNIQRGPELVDVDVTPDKNLDGSGRIGVQLSPNAKPHRVKAKGLPEALVLSSREFSRLTGTVIDGLKQIILNFEKTVDNVSGPVAIVAVGAEVARNDVAGLFQFAAIVNINLAIVNLLPLPALDGGYLAFVALEAIRGGKKLPDGVEQGIMSSGVLLLLMLGVVLMVRDTLNLGFVQQML